MRRSWIPALLLFAACGPLEPGDDCVTDCTGDTICVSTTCAPAFPRSYRLELAVSLGSEDPNGECWDDPLCGSPDPFVILRVDGREIGRTNEAGDTFNYRWSDTPFTVTLAAGSRVELEVNDGDVDFDDFATRCTIDAVTAAMLRTGQLSCAAMAGSSHVTADVTPLP